MSDVPYPQCQRAMMFPLGMSDVFSWQTCSCVNCTSLRNESAAFERRLSDFMAETARRRAAMDVYCALPFWRQLITRIPK